MKNESFVIYLVVSIFYIISSSVAFSQGPEGSFFSGPGNLHPCSSGELPFVKVLHKPLNCSQEYSDLFASTLLEKIGFRFQYYSQEYTKDFLDYRIKNYDIWAGIIYGSLQTVRQYPMLGLYGMLGLFGLTMAEGQGLRYNPKTKTYEETGKHFGVINYPDVDTVLEQAWVAANVMALDIKRLADKLVYASDANKNRENRTTLGKLLVNLYKIQEQRLQASREDPFRKEYIDFLEAIMPENWQSRSYEEIGRYVIQKLKGDDWTTFDKFLVFISVLFPYFLSSDIEKDGVISEYELLHGQAGYCPLYGQKAEERAKNPNEGMNIFEYVLALATYMLNSKGEEFIKTLCEFSHKSNQNKIYKSEKELEKQLRQWNPDNISILKSIDFYNPRDALVQIVSNSGYFSQVF